MIDGTGSTDDVIIPIGDSNATISFFEYVDPIVDLWFSKRGRVSKRRFLNMARMRLKPLYEKCNLDPAWIKQFQNRFGDAQVRQWVIDAMQPGYRMTQPEPPFAPLGQESGPFHKSGR